MEGDCVCGCVQVWSTKSTMVGVAPCLPKKRGEGGGEVGGGAVGGELGEGLEGQGCVTRDDGWGH